MEADERTRPTVDDEVPPPIPSQGARADERPETALEPAVPNERCAHHSARPAVARCAACREPVCLLCAVPVRERILGPGCVADELGDPALLAPPVADRSLSWSAVAGAVVAFAGTTGPWTRTGAGDRLLGAWVPDVRWSIVAAVAAVALVLVAWRSRRRGGIGATIVGGVAGIVLAASVLAIVFPPTFQTASWGPWVAGGGAVIAAVGALRSAGARTQGV